MKHGEIIHGEIIDGPHKGEVYNCKGEVLNLAVPREPRPLEFLGEVDAGDTCTFVAYLKVYPPCADRTSKFYYWELRGKE